MSTVQVYWKFSFVATTAATTSRIRVVNHTILQQQQQQLSSRRRKISSIGFSGAGFLIAYHLGVATCFHDQQLLRLPSLSSSSSTQRSAQKSTTDNHHHPNYVKLTGVSAGSIVAASLFANINPATDGMNAVLEISQKTRQQCAQSPFNALQPGFSLVDVVESVLKPLLHHHITKEYDSDIDTFLHTINTYGLLRIGLTDRRIFPPIGYNPNAFIYVDQYRNIDDIIASCILSSYIPGVTGPALGNMAIKNHAISRAAQQFNDMIHHGCVKKGTTGEVVLPTSSLISPTTSSSSSQKTQQITIPSLQSQNDNTTTNLNSIHHDNNNNNNNNNTNAITREICWDGGLVNAFPTFDHETIIVSPIAADFKHNKSINPSIEYNDNSNNNNSYDNPSSTTKATTGNRISKLTLNPMVSVHITTANIYNLKSMIITDNDDTMLQMKFQQGYNNAKQYCKQHSLINIHHHYV